MSGTGEGPPPIPPWVGAGEPMVLASFAGRHVLAEMREIPPAALATDIVVAALRRALDVGGATVLDVLAHSFEPAGTTVVAVLAESHASVHAYPEAGAAFVDVFTCGERADPERVVSAFAAEVGAGDVRARVVARGAGLAPAAGAREIDEPLSPGVRRRWLVDEVLWRERTAWQDVLVARTAEGVTLFCNGEHQSSEATQRIDHEALAGPALLLADRLDRVLVIGSSEGVLPQLALAAGAGHVTHADIDAECVRRCAELLPYGYDLEQLTAAERGAGRLTIRYADGWTVLDPTDAGRYDVIIADVPDEPLDVTEPTPHTRLYSRAFLQRCAAALAPGGVVASRAGFPSRPRSRTLARAARRFDDVFATVLPYCSDEQERAYLAGRVDGVADPVGLAVARLPERGAGFVTLDAEALRRGAVLPHAVRHSTEPG